MDIQRELQRMPEPDPKGAQRVLRRFRASRQETVSSRAPWMAPALALAAAATLWATVPRDTHRTLTLDASGTPESLSWSDQVQLEFAGHGAVSGTGRDVAITWEQGLISVQVAPNTASTLSVLTEEAVIDVVGTAFTVERDKTGVTVNVTHGKVAVSCRDGWSGHLVSTSEAHTCLPLHAAGLMARADAQLDQGAPPAEVLDTLNLGLNKAGHDSAERGELLVRRLHVHSQLGHRSLALDDADAYLTSGQTGRAVEVRQFASRIALYESCSRAMPYLEPLLDAGQAEDAVLFAECIATSDPSRARELLEQALMALENTWQQRARRALNTLESP